MKIWERHLLLRFFKTLSFCLLAVFAIYVLVDLSIHSVRFVGSKASCARIFFHYLHSLSIHLDFLLALSFLLATLRTLSHLMQHSECIALQMAGLSQHRLLRPLFLLATLLTLLSYLNAEWLAPSSLALAHRFREELRHRKNQPPKEPIHAGHLDDHSEIIYAHFDRNTLFDVYWICTPHTIWHMKTLTFTDPIQATFVDCFTRQEDNSLQLTASFPHHTFPNLPLSPHTATQIFTPFDERPLTTLLTQSLAPSADAHLIRSSLHYKLSKPLLPLFITWILAPITLRFSRQKKFLLLTAGSLFALLSFLTLLDGMLILAENQVLTPALALWSPWSLCVLLGLRLGGSAP